MATKTYVATVHLLVEANSVGEAADAIHAVLEDNPDTITDWGYALDDRGEPTEVTPPEKAYEEGDFLSWSWARQPQYLVITGNPVDGLVFNGPFPNKDVAIDRYSDEGGDWWVAPIYREGDEDADNT